MGKFFSDIGRAAIALAILTLGAKVLAIESVESQGAATVFLVLCIIVAVIGLGLGKAMKS